MKTVTFVSKHWMETFLSPGNVISIGCPGDTPPTFSSTPRRLLRVEFDDVDTFIDASYVMFDVKHARRILDFIEQCNGEDIIVHCHAGVSRSAAIAQFISTRLGYTVEKSKACNGDFSQANGLVYSLLTRLYLDEPIEIDEPRLIMI